MKTTHPWFFHRAQTLSFLTCFHLQEFEISRNLFKLSKWVSDRFLCLFLDSCFCLYFLVVQNRCQTLMLFNVLPPSPSSTSSKFQFFVLTETSIFTTCPPEGDVSSSFFVWNTGVSTQGFNALPPSRLKKTRRISGGVSATWFSSLIFISSCCQLYSLFLAPVSDTQVF